MPFDPFHAVVKLENKSPAFARFLAMVFLSWISPFNARLKAKLLHWDSQTCVISLKRRRAVRNHVGSIHAGALFMLGETCAGLVIIRNFPFGQYRPLMSDVKVHYSKQARGDVVGKCIIAPEIISRMKEDIAREEVSFVDILTEIRNLEGEVICNVTTTWQVKEWGLVQTRA
jgi:acyl-coenzyme A thioesterase PaaI-like protein